MTNSFLMTISRLSKELSAWLSPSIPGWITSKFYLDVRWCVPALARRSLAKKHYIIVKRLCHRSVMSFMFFLHAYCKLFHQNHRISFYFPLPLPPQSQCWHMSAQMVLNTSTNIVKGGKGVFWCGVSIFLSRIVVGTKKSEVWLYLIILPFFFLDSFRKTYVSGFNQNVFKNFCD